MPMLAPALALCASSLALAPCVSPCVSTLALAVEVLSHYYAGDYSYPPDVPLAIITIESNWDTTAETKYAFGLFQLHKRYFKHCLTPLSQHIQCGLNYIQELFDRFKDERQAICYYLAGATAGAKADAKAGAKYPPNSTACSEYYIRYLQARILWMRRLDHL